MMRRDRERERSERTRENEEDESFSVLCDMRPLLIISHANWNKIYYIDRFLSHNRCKDCRQNEILPSKKTMKKKQGIQERQKALVYCSNAKKENGFSIFIMIYEHLETIVHPLFVIEVRAHLTNFFLIFVK